MLTLNKAELAPRVSGVTIYRDDELDCGFYMLAGAPHILRVDGAPQMSLVIHGSGDGKAFKAAGGFFNCTTSLGVPHEIHQTAEETLRRNLTDQAGEETANLRWLQPDWRSGYAEVVLPTGMRLKSQPSLMGDNDCVFHGAISAVEAVELDERWRRGDGELSVSYELMASVRGAPQGVKFAFQGRVALSSKAYAVCVRRIAAG